MKGILMKPWGIQATVELRKTVTRRCNQLKEINKEPDKWEYMRTLNDGSFLFWVKADDPELDIDKRTKLIKPRYQVGDTVYIKEAWQSLGNKENIVYKMDGESKLIWDINGKHGEEIVRKWRSPLFMPEWAARHFIKITGVRAERVQEITEDDAIKEGITDDYCMVPHCEEDERIGRYDICYVDAYRRLWDSINPSYPFESNPWDFRYEYKYQGGK